MKYLVCILILLFASPAFAGGSSSAFSGANNGIDAEPAIIQETPVAEREAEFKIDEKLYSESIGSSGYYGGGFYGEERYQSQVAYYTVTSHRRDFGFGTGFIVVKDQLVPINLGSSFLVPLPILSSRIFSGGVSIGVGGFSFGLGGFGHGHFGHGHR